MYSNIQLTPAIRFIIYDSSVVKDLSSFTTGLIESTGIPGTDKPPEDQLSTLKVNQVTDFNPGYFQVINELGFHDRRELSNGFQLNDKAVINNQISHIGPNLLTHETHLAKFSGNQTEYRHEPTPHRTPPDKPTPKARAPDDCEHRKQYQSLCKTTLLK